MFGDPEMYTITVRLFIVSLEQISSKMQNLYISSCHSMNVNKCDMSPKTKDIVTYIFSSSMKCNITARNQYLLLIIPLAIA